MHCTPIDVQHKTETCFLKELLIRKYKLLSWTFIQFTPKLILGDWKLYYGKNKVSYD